MSEDLHDNFYANTWRVVDRYFTDTPLFVTRHHIDSFNNFLHHGIRSAIQTMNPNFQLVTKTQNVDGKDVKYNAYVTVGGKDGSKIYIDKPTLVHPTDVSDGGKPVTQLVYPNEARLKGMTYASNVYADVTIDYTVNGKPVGTKEFRVRICKLPIMLHSAACVLNGCSPDLVREMGECPYDMGGYFIIDGLEKVIIAQEKTVNNRLFVFKGHDDKEATHVAIIKCVDESRNLFPWTIKFRVISSMVSQGRRKDAIVISLPKLTAELPLFVVFRMLGVETDREIIDIIVSHVQDENTRMTIRDFLRASVIDAAALGIYTQSDAMMHAAAYTDYKTPERMKIIMQENVLTIAGNGLRDKAMYLGHLTCQIVRTCIGQLPVSYKDHFSQKRLRLSGFLAMDMFRDTYVKFVQQGKERLDKAYFYGPWRNTGRIEALVNASNVNFIFDAVSMDRRIMTSFKGRWNYDDGARPGQQSAHAQDGVIQDLSRVSYQLYLSYMRRVDIDFDRSRKIADPHYLLGSHWGAVCPVESPDGPSVGLIKHIALLTHVTFPVDASPILTIMNREGLLNEDRTHMLGGAKVFVNDVWVGNAQEDAYIAARYLRALRRSGLLHPTTSVSYKPMHKELRIATDAGRLARPLYIVDRDVDTNSNRLRIRNAHLARLDAGSLTWWQLVNSTEYPVDSMTSWIGGAVRIEDLDKKRSAYENIQSFIDAMESAESVAVVEYIDVEEQDTALIGTTPADLESANGRLQRYTHCEMHSCAIFSMASAIIPLLHHNNAAYNALALAQTKQAIGVYVTNFSNRFDIVGMILNYPQLPFVTTRFAERLCDGRLCHGDNLVVAIATYTGYNQEDACIINSDSCMRGMFNVTCYETLKYNDEEYGREALMVANPVHIQSKGTSVEGIKALDYSHLDERGLPLPGTILREGILLIGMVHVKTVEVDASGTELQSTNYVTTEKIGKNVVRKKVYTDRSIIADRSHEGRIVDKVFTYRDESGNMCSKMRLRHVRSPELGDKMATRFAQKGVVGMLMRREDMPYTSTGVVPDIIINPHSHPKRMTVGHLLDCLLSKVACVHGTRLQTNAFEPKDVDGLQDLLETRYGLDRCGDEIMYNGMTGCQIQCAIFTGLNYYGRLKHMVADKMNFRDAGPRNFLTRQATKGRGKHGGLRIGEMEENAILAHGASGFLKESFMERADKHEMYVDARTGVASTVISNDSAGVLTTMGPTDAPSMDVRPVAVPYAFKLLQQELQGMSIDARVVIDHDEDDDEDEDDLQHVDDLDMFTVEGDLVDDDASTDGAVQ